MRVYTSSTVHVNIGAYEIRTEQRKRMFADLAPQLPAPATPATPATPHAVLCGSRARSASASVENLPQSASQTKPTLLSANINSCMKQRCHNLSLHSIRLVSGLHHFPWDVAVEHIDGVLLLLAELQRHRIEPARPSK
jgi:hypothetical protein